MSSTTAVIFRKNSVLAVIYYLWPKRHLFARKLFQLRFKGKVINKQKEDFARIKHNLLINFIMNMRRISCFFNDLIVNIILFHFSKQDIAALARGFFL